MRPAALLALALLLGGCAGGVETLRPASGSEPAIRAAIERPEGAGPFPVAVLLHGAGGLQSNTGSWSALLRGRGWLVVTPDQFGPRGIREVYSTGRYTESLFHRIEDTLALLALLRQRPEVRADRVALIGFSQGGRLAASMLDEAIRHRYEAARLPRPVAAIGVYSDCHNLPTFLTGPLLLIHGTADDWALISRCEAAPARMRSAPVPPELLAIAGAHHDFDAPRAAGLVTLRDAVNAASPTGRGATLSYSPAATRQAQAAALAFLEARR